MHETISQPPSADPSPADLLRTMLCTLCWAPPGRPCTVSSPPGDHLARFVAAVKQGLLKGKELDIAIQFVNYR